MTYLNLTSLSLNPKLPQDIMKPPPSSKTSPLTILLLLLPFGLLAVIFLVLYPNEFRLQSLVSSGCSRLATTTAFSDVTGPISPKPDFRLFIGILTRADLYERRHMLRLVYAVQPKVANVVIDVRFVFCRLYKEDQQTLIPMEIMAYNDIIILDCPENMNEGKTYTYFASLPRLFNEKINNGERPYDYVMKVDDDTYVRLPQLVDSLRPLPRYDMYYGAIIPCESKDPFHEYMAGLGYILSWDLVKWISISPMARNRSTGPEDMMTGTWLRDANKAKNRYGMRAVMYDYPVPHSWDMCSHNLVPETVAVHRLKDNPHWALALKYFNVTDGLEPSKFYNLQLLLV